MFLFVLCTIVATIGALPACTSSSGDSPHSGLLSQDDRSGGFSTFPDAPIEVDHYLVEIFVDGELVTGFNRVYAAEFGDSGKFGGSGHANESFELDQENARETLGLEQEGTLAEREFIMAYAHAPPYEDLETGLMFVQPRPIPFAAGISDEARRETIESGRRYAVNRSNNGMGCVNPREPVGYELCPMLLYVYVGDGWLYDEDILPWVIEPADWVEVYLDIADWEYHQIHEPNREERYHEQATFEIDIRDGELVDVSVRVYRTYWGDHNAETSYPDRPYDD